MTTRGQINSNFYQIVNVDVDGNPTTVKTSFIQPAGTNTQVQFNDGNTLASNSSFTFNKVTGVLTVPTITGNITGNATNALHANIADVANSVAGANVSGTVANATHATVADSANSVAGANVTGTVANATHATVSNSANSVAGANVTGTVANANYASYSSNANSVNANIANVIISGGSNGYLLSTNGTGTLAWTAPPSATSIVNGTSNVSIPTSNGNVNISVGGVSNIVVVSTTGLTTAGDITANAFYGNVYGNIVGNIVVPGVNTSVIFNTNGNADGSANFLYNKVTDTLTVPNIDTSGLNVAGNALISGNLTVSGNITYTNVNNLYITDPLIEMGGGPNGTPLTNNDGLDRGEILHYYTTEPVDAFIGWDNSNAEFALASNVTVSNNLVTINQLGNVRAYNYIQDVGTFNTATVATAGVGQFAWNDSDGTLDLGLKGGNVTLQLGEELLARVYNEDVVTLTDGMIVQITGAQGNRIAVKRAQANNETNSVHTLGMVTETIAVGAEGFITTVGTVHHLNTIGLTEGATLYLSPSTPGAYTQTKPSAPNQLVVIGFVERVHATVGSIYVKVDNGYELDELHNVLITAPVNGQALVYDSANSIWVNGATKFLNASNSNVIITGGSSGNVLITDGLGNLSWGSAGATPGGANTNLQFNNNGALGGISTVTWDGLDLSLGSVSNVKMTGGSSNLFVRTDGAGNLSFQAITSNLTVGTRTVAVNIGITNYQMNVEARTGNVVVNVN